MNPKVKNALEWTYCIVIAVALALLVRYFVGTPTIVKQPSMYPTLKPDQRLILNRLAITFHKDLNRGDIITFEAPSKIRVTDIEADLSDPVAEYKNGPKNIFSKFTYYVLEIGKTSYIKRVIGLPGEHIKIENNKVYINGKELKEDYLRSDVVTTNEGGAFYDLIVPDDTYFVMGDNRTESTDSRSFGCVPYEKIESKVALRFWPLSLWGNPDK
ncbi:MAG: signal peptidase I [Clostridia bacterium]|nr:signal peptidase I [Clostridia bacterium]